MDSLLKLLLNHFALNQGTYYNPKGTQSLDFKNQLSSLPLYNDLGQRWGQPFNDQNVNPGWVDKTWQSLQNNDQLFNQQIPPLSAQPDLSSLLQSLFGGTDGKVI